MSSSRNESEGCRDFICLDVKEEEDEDKVLWLGCVGEEDDMDEGPSYTSIEELEKQLIDKVVNSEEEAYKLYCDYAHVMGFSVRKWKQYYFHGTKKIRSKMFCCSKEGVRDEKGDTNGTCNKLEKRTGCQAMIYFTCDENSKWKVARFVKEHNHEMAQPYERNLLRSVRLASAARGRIIDPRELYLTNSAHEAGISENAISLDNDEEKIVCLHCKGEVYMNDGSFDAYIEDLEEKLPGQVVHSEEVAYELYCDYARLKGFSVRRGKQYYFVGTNKVKWKTYCCSKEGVKNEKENTSGTTCNKVDTRTGCKAKISFSCDNSGQWKVTTFVKEHNHEMVKPHERHLLRSAFSNAMDRASESAESFNLGGSTWAVKSSGGELFASEGDLILQPHEGMVFESIDAAHSFYNEYARHVGFATCLLGCNKEGHCASIRGIFGPLGNLQPSMSESCRAMILLKPDKSEKWTLLKFVKDHNHPLLLYPRRPQHTMDEKDKKIQELTAELRNKRRMCSMYQEQLIAFTKVVEEYGDQLSKKVGYVVNNLKEVAPLGEELSSFR